MPSNPTFGGIVNINVGPAIHKRLYNAAKKNGQSMTAYALKAIKEKLARKE